MTLPLADWYDDPEDPTMLRYWDGRAWANDRRPKQVAPPQSTDLGDIFTGTFALARKMLLPSLAMGAIWAITVGAIFAASLLLLLGSSSPAVIAALVILWLMGMVAAMVGFLGWTRLAVARHNDVALSIGDALRGGFRRMPRALFFFVMAALSGIAVVVTLGVIGALGPDLLVIAIPVLGVAAIWLWTYMTISGVVVAAGPDQPGSFTTLKEVVAGKWWFLAGRILVFNIVVILAGGVLQTFSGGAAAGMRGIGALIVILAINVVVQFFLSLYQYSMPIVLYAMIGGTFDSELAPTTTASDVTDAL